MRILLLTVALALVASVASAQDIGPVRPDVSLQSPTEMQAQGTFVSDGSWTQCLIVDGADHLNAASHFECKPITLATGITSDHLVIVTSDGGDVVVRGVTVNASGTVSEPSSNKKTVLSIPFAPNLLSDGPELDTADLA